MFVIEAFSVLFVAGTKFLEDYLHELRLQGFKPEKFSFTEKCP